MHFSSLQGGRKPAECLRCQADLLHARSISLVCQLQCPLCIISRLLQLLLDALNLELPILSYLH